MGDATPITLVTDPPGIAALVSTLRRDRIIAIDTEADSFYHYYDKLCLLQIGCKAGMFLVDPLRLPKNGLAPLIPIFEDPDIRKVLHAADYDLYMLHGYGGIHVRSIFDSMVCAQLLGYPGVGLGALVERHFGVKLSKDQQRTDWSRRPLSDLQIEYAASDVLYLTRMVPKLEKELRAKHRLAWAEEEFELLERKRWPKRQFDGEGYLRIKGAKKLQAQNLAVLRELFMVRDQRARNLDRPPFKVLGNGTLLDLAIDPPTSRAALARRKGVTELVLRRLGGEILEGIRRGLEGPEHPPLERRSQGGRRRLDRRAELRLEHLKRWRRTQARELEMDPGVLCSNAVLEQIAAKNPHSSAELRKLEGIRSWQFEVLGDEVIEDLQKLVAPRREERPPETRAQAPRRRKSASQRGPRGSHKPPRS